MSEDRKTERGYLFRWKSKSAPNPSGRFAERVRHLTLLCNQCDEPVISGTPYNLVGQRYFTYYANQAAIAHLANHESLESAKRLSSDDQQHGQA